MSIEITDSTKVKAELLTNDEASVYLGVSPGTLEVWRCTKRYKIPFIKVGRLVKYRKSALDNFLENQTVDGEPQ